MIPAIHRNIPGLHVCFFGEQPQLRHSPTDKDNGEYPGQYECFPHLSRRTFVDDFQVLLEVTVIQ